LILDLGEPLCRLLRKLLASGYPLHHLPPHGVRFAHLLAAAGGSAAIPLAKKLLLGYGLQKIKFIV
jgi:hypothetical protein